MRTSVVGARVSAMVYESTSPDSDTTVFPPLWVITSAGSSSSATSAAIPSTGRPFHVPVVDSTEWVIRPLWPVRSSAATTGASPATSMVSLPSPPYTSTATPGGVASTVIVSLPSAPSTPSRSIATKATNRPAPYTPAAVTTKKSSASVPMTNSESKPSPPLTFTGELVTYEMVSAPAPATTCVSESSSRNVRMTNVSSSSSPFRLSTARLRNTRNRSSPSPPLSVASTLIPFDSSPCVVSIIAGGM